MFDVGIGGSPAENYENLIRGSRKSAPGQGEFEMELEFADIQAERAAELNRWEAERQREIAEERERKRRLDMNMREAQGMPPTPQKLGPPARRPSRGLFLPEERGGTAIGRDISRQAEEAAARREEIRNRPLPLGPGQHPGGHIQQDSRDRYPPRNR